MVLIPVLCPHCQSDQVIKGGTTQAGTQRYHCHSLPDIFTSHFEMST